MSEENGDSAFTCVDMFVNEEKWLNNEFSHLEIWNVNYTLLGGENNVTLKRKIDMFDQLETDRQRDKLTDGRKEDR